MLNQYQFSRARFQRQRGVVLMVALIVLVALTLAGLALMRSLDTTNLIAGNLAFQQSATHSGDIGTEAAITWLQNNTNTTSVCPDSTTQRTLYCNNSANGYFSARLEPAAGQTWDAFWTASLAQNAVSMAQDVTTGNTVSYVIHRLCNANGDPTSVPSPGCAFSMTSPPVESNSKEAGFVAPVVNVQVYYRITSRIVGPRNATSYVQTIISL